MATLDMLLFGLEDILAQSKNFYVFQYYWQLSKQGMLKASETPKWGQ